jgi:peptide/nickel transport system substrate-binding protein
MAQASGLPIIPKHFYSRFSPTQINQSTGLLMGSGPFKLANLDPQNQWTPPNDIVLVRNEGYWGAKPALDSVRFKVVQDSLARLTTFSNGDADMARPTSQQFDLKRNDPEFTQSNRAVDWYNMQGGWSFIAWQCGLRNRDKLTPFADARVRMAMTHLIDRERIKRDINKDLARIATGPFNSETQQADPTIKPWPYDPARGQALLKEAGWEDRNGDGVLDNEKGDRFTFQLTFGQGNDSTLQMVTYIKDQCAKAGIVCELNPVDWSIIQDLLNRRDFDAITFAWSSSSPESNPRQLWAISSIEGTGDNFVQWRSERADELIKQGVRTIDFDARMKIWHQLHQEIHKEQPYTPLMELPWLRLVNNRVGNFVPYKSGMEVHEFFIPLGSQKSQ